MLRIFRISYPIFLFVMALMVGGACYQTVSINPFWLNDLNMFKNYGHWGIDYFPVLSPMMTILWLVVLISGFRLRMPQKALWFTGHFIFLVVIVATFVYFVPFLLTYMGQPQQAVSDAELSEKLANWSKLDRIRQCVGLIPLAIFIYCYGNVRKAMPPIRNRILAAQV